MTEQHKQPRPNWRERAACKGTFDRDMDVWDLDEQRRTKWARRYCTETCALCPVTRECAADALERGAVGVFRAGIPCRGMTAPRAEVQLLLEVVANGC